MRGTCARSVQCVDNASKQLVNMGIMRGMGISPPATHLLMMSNPLEKHESRHAS